MPEILAERRAPAGVASPMLRPLPPAARLLLRGGPEVMAAAGSILSFALPQQPCRSAVAGERAALWLGPDERLLLAPDGEGEALCAGLAEALHGLRHSVVDVSHRQGAFEVAGLHAALLLNTACPLDLQPAAFPIGMCTRTLLGKAEIVLWRRAPLTFHVEVWRSFHAYATGLLAQAAEEFAS